MTQCKECRRKGGLVGYQDEHRAHIHGIVAGVEARLGPAIIRPDGDHTARCRCMGCFNAQLDRLLEGKSNEWGDRDDQIGNDATG